MLSESGDLKKARVRLRATMQRKSHHFSAFRSGLYLGIALPAFVDGIYKCEYCALSSITGIGLNSHT